MAIDDKLPFETVLTHGHVVDDQGRKMSKSLGNVIAPQDIIKDYGADILRLWVAASDYNEDIRISKEMLARLAEAYRKIRNTARFILSNLYDFNPDTDKVDWDGLKSLDRWVLIRMRYQLLPELENSFDNFQFHKAYKAVFDFCNETLSMQYLDMAKGRLYTNAANSQERRAAQTASYEILHSLARVISPILVFTAEEIWQNMPKAQEFASVASVHLLGWPVAPNKEGLSLAENIEFAALEEYVLPLIPDIAKILEGKRSQGLIGSSFDAKIKLLTNNKERYTFLASLGSDLSEIFKVSQVEILKGAVNPDPAIEVSKADGAKCVRCWNYLDTVGKDEAHPMLCHRCVKAIGG